MNHTIKGNRADGSSVEIEIVPLKFKGILKCQKFINFLHGRGIFTTEDLIEKIKDKAELKEFTTIKKWQKMLSDLYEKVTEGFRNKSYKTKIFDLLKQFNNQNLRLRGRDVAVMATSIIFKKLIDSWQFIKKNLSQPILEKIDCKEQKWQKIYATYL